MALTVKCFATLEGFTPQGGEMPYTGGQTVAEVIAALGIDAAEVKVVFVNGAHAPLDRPVSDNDRVGIFPAVGGG